MYDLVAATLDLPILIMCRWNFNNDYERRRQRIHYDRSQKSTSKVLTKLALKFPLNTRSIRSKTLIT